MAKKAESTSWESLRIELRAALGTRAIIERIESPISPGIFDAFLAFTGRSAWLEGKCLTDGELPKKCGTVVQLGIGTDQNRFARACASNGVCHMLWARIRDKTSAKLPPCWLVMDRVDEHDLARLTLNELAGIFIHGPKKLGRTTFAAYKTSGEAAVKLREWMENFERMRTDQGALHINRC